MGSELHLNRAKFFRPTLGSDIVQREHLWKLLDEGADLPITLISAPAGYGKSTLVSSWLNQIDTPYIWISIEEADSNLHVFLKNFIRGLRQINHDFGIRLESLLASPQPTSIENLSLEFVNAIALLSKKINVVFDDYHLIQNQDIHNFISHYLKYPNRNFHLLLISRSDPSIKIQEYRQKGWLMDIRARDLVFKREEITEFLDSKKIEGLQDMDLEKIHRITEGWPTGLRLLTIQNGRSGAFKERLNNYSSSDLLYTGIVKSYLDKSPAMNDFVLMLSCLSHFNPDICDHIISKVKLKVNNSRSIIDNLIADSFFIIPLDDRDHAFRFHDLIKGHLFKQLRSSWTPDKISTIHCAAADWYQEQNQPHLAIEQFIRGKEYSKGLRIFKNYRLQLHKEMNWSALEDIIKQFPESVAKDSLEIQLSKAWLLIYYGDVFEMFSKLDLLEQQLRNTELHAVALEAEWKSLQVYKLYNISQDYDKCVEACSFAINHLPNEHVYALGYSWIFLGGALQIKRGTAEAVKRIKKGIAGIDNPTVNSHQWLVICYMYWISGEVELLIKSSKSLIDLGQRSNNLEALANGHNFCGIAYYARGDFKMAEASLLKFYELRYNTIAVIHIMGMVALCKCFYELSKETRLSAALDEMTKLIHLQKDNYFGQLLGVLKADISLRKGWDKLALGQISKLEKIPLVPLSNFYCPQITIVRILLSSKTKAEKAKADDLIGQLEEIIYRTKNARFLVDLLLLKSELEFSKGEKTLADGYLTKAIKQAHVNQIVSPFLEINSQLLEIAQDICKREFPAFYEVLRNIVKTCRKDTDLQLPSSRELEVLKLLKENLSNKQIANALYISEKTVKRHCGNLFKKLDVNNRREAVIKWQELQLSH